MVDSVARHPKLTSVCCAHEQGAGTAADGYSRISRNIGAAIVTSGPGPTNLVTSIANCWYDSIPAIFLCGQVATFRIKKRKELRQKGFQETDVAPLFSSLTKYVAIVRRAEDIRYEMEKSVYLAKSGRPGPVVLDIPDDIQREEIDPFSLRKFEARNSKSEINAKHKNSNDQNVLDFENSDVRFVSNFATSRKALAACDDIRISDLSKVVKKIFSFIQQSKRPVIIIGVGIRIAGVEKEALQFARYFRLPVVSTWGGKDLISSDDPLSMGPIGVSGPRAGNFAVQRADCIIAIGTRLSQLVTGGKQDLFAPKAKKVMIDIDPEELKKFTEKEFLLDISVAASFGDFFAECRALYHKKNPDRFDSWRKRIRRWQETFPICPPAYHDQRTPVNPYVFIKALSAAAHEGEIVVGDTGANLAWTMQAFDVKKDQRIISGWNHTPMGYALPAAIGAAFASGRRVLCLMGDGGLMMCLGELATAVRHNLPIKIFLFNNHGHAIQRQTIDTWLQSRYTGVDVPSGLAFPDFVHIGRAFTIKTVTIKRHTELKRGISSVLRSNGPVLCNVEMRHDNKIIPYLRYGSSLEDMEPPISQSEKKSLLDGE